MKKILSLVLVLTLALTTVFATSAVEAKKKKKAKKYTYTSTYYANGGKYFSCANRKKTTTKLTYKTTSKSDFLNEGVRHFSFKRKWDMAGRKYFVQRGYTIKISGRTKTLKAIWKKVKVKGSAKIKKNILTIMNNTEYYEGPAEVNIVYKDKKHKFIDAEKNCHFSSEDDRTCVRNLKALRNFKSIKYVEATIIVKDSLNYKYKKLCKATVK